VTVEQTEAFFNPSTPGPILKGLFLGHDGVTVLELPSAFSGSSFNTPVVTDDVGHFAIDSVLAGTYAVMAGREGYFGRGSDPESPGSYDGAAMTDMVLVTVAPGRNATVTMELVPAAAISGQITGPDGRILIGQDVRAFRAHREGAQTRLAGVSVVTTDDLGHYRLHTLPPGEYFIASGLGLPEFGGDSDAVPQPMIMGAEVSVLTFYPSVTDPQAEPPIVLNGGEDIENKDIRVHRAPFISISGYVVNGSSIRDAAIASIELVAAKKNWIIHHGGVLGNAGIVAGTGAAFAEPDRGRFELRGAFPPGAYEIRAIVESTTPGSRVARKALGSTQIDVGSQDVEGVVITIEAGNNR
jgi:hypothetical protein